MFLRTSGIHVGRVVRHYRKSQMAAQCTTTIIIMHGDVHLYKEAASQSGIHTSSLRKTRKAIKSYSSQFMVLHAGRTLCHHLHPSTRRQLRLVALQATGRTSSSIRTSCSFSRCVCGVNPAIFGIVFTFGSHNEHFQRHIGGERIG